MGLKFGSSSQEQSSRPLLGTAGTSITGDKIMLDPEVARLRQSGMEGMQQAAGQYGGQLSQLFNQTYGNLPDYVNAQVAPLQQNIAQQRGQLSQSLGMRGLGGSSFGQQSMTSQALDQARALMNARAQATSQGAGQIAGLAGQQFGAAQAGAGAQSQAAQDLLRQELALLSLSKQGKGTGSSSGLDFKLFG